ncbi:MAG TPA: serine hydrolase [Candidatus Eisenbacteria bacterium]|nr:serine hydrolase [Candidatus Eisenbacteria bacterium]
MRSHRWWTLVLAASLGVPSSATGAPLPRDLSARLDTLVREAMAIGMNPGMSVAVVSGDEIVWARGFGDADLSRSRPITPDTRFYIGSTSKALTALAAAQLAAAGTLDLDAPLTRLFPTARIPAGVAAESVTVRALLTHTHGISGDGPVSMRVAFTGEYTEAHLLRVLEKHGPASRGRAFQYSNLGYDLAGVVLSGGRPRGWREVVERQVTQPLGMKATTAYRSRVPEALIAQPHELGVNGLERIRLGKEDPNMGPAGGHFSSARDMARLLIAELNQGRVDGRAAIPAAVIAETQRIQATQDREFTYFHRHGWGLGWDLGTFDGDTLHHRFGSFTGYRSHVSFMRDHGLGVVVLTNGGNVGAMLVDLIAAGIYDEMRSRPDARARHAARLETMRDRIAKAREQLTAETRPAASARTLRRPLDAYTGSYAHPDWGTLVLSVEDGRLVASMGVARSAVEVIDAEKDHLRVELFGGGTTLNADFPEGATRAETLRLRDVTFRRR